MQEEIKAFLGVHTKRLTGLLQLSKTWREEVANADLMHDITEAVIGKRLGDYWMSTATMMEIGPGNPLQQLHRDFGNWWPAQALGTDAPELMLNFLLATTETNVKNGATRAIAGSHKWKYDFDDENLGAEEMTAPVELQPGDCFIIGGKIVHGGGCNSTEDFLRRVISCVMVTSAFTQEEAFAHTVPLDLVKTLAPRLQQALGFRSVWPKHSPGLWTSGSDEIGKHLGLVQ
ncbi:uncharacterized protein B0I36DRAFT_332025 [Microdochium trichocladiopsis]|uniref:Phytanoyl-CoA dioxygenase n=1 Tax=Microdochium trichocladiopsis TaxID=1682393 RepID=A0A9P9BLC3_9PEZI|nr:uncharacterized protein B0I36DRAFT_332025 [Microdochium trichocladiopsis]KAH7024777.1 hypothetical protein B0I36DRAFT_332025 [Microdochium trichocladiopsis]